MISRFSYKTYSIAYGLKTSFNCIYIRSILWPKEQFIFYNAIPRARTPPHLLRISFESRHAAKPVFDVCAL